MSEVRDGKEWCEWLRKATENTQQAAMLAFQHDTLDVGLAQHLHRAVEEIMRAWDIVDRNVNGDYAAYLASEQWRAIRNRVLCRDDFKCQRCGDGGRTEKMTAYLEVHHITYERRGAELLEDLVTLCRRCHGWVHETNLFAAGRFKETDEELADWSANNPDFIPQ